MEKKLKLSPKQLNALQNIQTQKQQLQGMSQDLNQKESLVVELVIEAANISTEDVKNIRLEGDTLVYETKEAPKVKAKDKKPE